MRARPAEGTNVSIDHRHPHEHRALAAVRTSSARWLQARIRAEPTELATEVRCFGSGGDARRRRDIVAARAVRGRACAGGAEPRCAGASYPFGFIRSPPAVGVSHSCATGATAEYDAGVERLTLFDDSASGCGPQRCLDRFALPDRCGTCPEVAFVDCP